MRAPKLAGRHRPNRTGDLADGGEFVGAEAATLPEPEGQVVWRALNPDDAASLDAGGSILPKDSAASKSTLEHVLQADSPSVTVVPLFKSQKTSTTTNRDFASRWNDHGMVEVDLGKVPSTVDDLTTAAGRTQHLGDASRAPPGSPVHRANKLAKGAS